MQFHTIRNGVYPTVYLWPEETCPPSYVSLSLWRRWKTLCSVSTSINPAFWQLKSSATKRPLRFLRCCPIAALTGTVDAGSHELFTYWHLRKAFWKKKYGLSNILFCSIAVGQESSLKAEIWTLSTELLSTLNPKKATSSLCPLYEL